ncbi:MAG: DoxX family protein [Acidobacteriota bacterium]
MRFLRPFSEQLFALLRIVAGLLFAIHGAQKLFGAMGGTQVHEPLMVAAGVIELVCGLLVAGGLFTSVAAFLASGEMAAAFFKAHAPNGFNPVVNKGELAVVYSFLFLYIAARGSGLWSLDAMMGKTKSKEPVMEGKRRDH